jgi:hypothetical protein
VAGAASALDLPLNPDLGLVAERGRGLLLFSALTRRRPQRGVFGSIVEPQAAIHRYAAEHNDAPAPFAWTESPDQIVGKLERLNASVH